MTDELSLRPRFNLTPRNFEEAKDFASMISESSFCPKDFVKRPGDVLCAIQFASEVGLSPMQGLQNIAVINGKPSLYGDAALAICKSHPAFVSITERGSSEAASKGGECRLVVRNSDGSTTEVVRTFTPDDAKRAKLIGKSGPWTDYPGRMYQMRARAFALRDGLPEALKGIAIREEVEDYVVTSRPFVPPTSAPERPAQLDAPHDEPPIGQEPAAEIDPKETEALAMIAAAETMNDMKVASSKIAALKLSGPVRERVLAVYKAKQGQLKGVK